MSRLDIPGSEIQSLLTPENCALTLIDYQPQPVFHIQSIDRQTADQQRHRAGEDRRRSRCRRSLRRSLPTNSLARCCPSCATCSPDAEVIDRNSLNAWQDPEFRAAVEATGRRRLIMAGIWTEVCLAVPALSAREAGYEGVFRG